LANVKGSEPTTTDDIKQADIVYGNLRVDPMP